MSNKKTSLPSLPVAAISLPQVTNFEAKFQYNFFVADERVNDSGRFVTSTEINTRALAQADLSDSDIKRSIPRLMRLTFRPVKSQPATTEPFASLKKASSLSSIAAAKKIDIASNLDKIITEEHFANVLFFGFDIQDSGIDDRLYYLVSGSLASRLNSPGSLSVVPTPTVPGDLTYGQTRQFLDTIFDQTDNALSDRVMSNKSTKGLLLANGKEIRDAVFKRVKQAHTHLQINGKHAYKMMAYAAYQSDTIFADELAGQLGLMKRIEQQSIKQNDPTQVGLSDYDCTLPFLSVLPAQPGQSEIETQLLGYIIDKYEIDDATGAARLRPALVIENGNSSFTFDTQLKYGMSYSYAIRSIHLVKFPALDANDPSKPIDVACLVASRSSKRQVVRCEENVPPPSPADFKIAWDFGLGFPRLTWSLPPNPQRDVKKIQVFKRDSIDKPFQLLKMYDFNDAVSPAPDAEHAEPALVLRSDQPVLMHIDHSFQQAGESIYALCCIDAHGLTSNYSEQFRVRFDAFKNRLDVTLLSRSGAPKSYPNMWLPNELFADAAKDTGHSNLRVYFDPEALSLHDAKGSDLGYIGFKQQGVSYRLQIINTDRQKQQDVDISIDDRRPPAVITAGYRRL